jgi:queuosine precursor transporter
VFAANWAINRFGPVSVGFGLLAPAGVYFAGLAFLVRDTTQRLGGKVLVLAAIAIGAACSALVDTHLALASGIAFLVSELADFAVFTRLREGLPASIASNVIGAVLDSYLFLTLAGFGLAFFWGQVVGKLWITAPVVLALVLVRARKLASA